MFKKITFPNGLQLLLVPQKGAKAAAVLVLVEAGSKYEKKELSGISHFLEHMMFKGTKRRPTPLIVATDLDRIGGQSNAFTSHEYTGYWAKGDAGHLELILDIISDVFQNSLLEPNELEKEKGVVIQEMNMYFDLPQRHVFDLWTELLYGDQPAGWPVIGSKETIRRLTRDDVVAYIGTHYVATRTTVVVAGDFDEEDMKSRVERFFYRVPAGDGGTKLPVSETQDAPALKLHFKETDQTHIVLGTRTFSARDERQYALEVLNTVLGAGMSSRLFQELREKRGAAYYVRSGADLYTDHGYLAASGGFEHEKIDEVISAILAEFKRLQEDLVPHEELEKAKEHIKGSLILNTETVDELASFYGPQEMISGERKTPEQYLSKIQTVSAEAVRNLAREIFKNNALNLAMIGPSKERARFLDLLHL